MRRLLCIALLLASCAAEPTAGRDEGAPIEAAEPSDDGPQRYDTLEAIARDIGCTDLEDVGTGGNAGLREFGVCMLSPHNLDLYLISDRSWNYLTEDFDAVVGSGWIVVCPTGPRAAGRVHAAIGGKLTTPAEA